MQKQKLLTDLKLTFLENALKGHCSIDKIQNHGPHKFYMLEILTIQEEIST